MLYAKPARSVSAWVLAGLLFLAGGVTQTFAQSEADFQKIGSKYGVSPHLLFAIGIVESQQGQQIGRYRVEDVVSSTQLNYLKKIARHTGRPISEFKGSRAGAMGYMQIVPSTFYTYAQDGDGDGMKDPLNPHDSLATAAYFLARAMALNDNNLRSALRVYNNSGVYYKQVSNLSRQLEMESTFAAR